MKQVSPLITDFTKIWFQKRFRDQKQVFLSIQFIGEIRDKKILKTYKSKGQKKKTTYLPLKSESFSWVNSPFTTAVPSHWGAGCETVKKKKLFTFLKNLKTGFSYSLPWSIGVYVELLWGPYILEDKRSHRHMSNMNPPQVPHCKQNLIKNKI